MKFSLISSINIVQMSLRTHAITIYKPCQIDQDTQYKLWQSTREINHIKPTRVIHCTNCGKSIIISRTNPRPNRNLTWIDNINDKTKEKLRNATQIFNKKPGASFKRILSAHLPNSVFLYEDKQRRRTKVFFQHYDEFNVWGDFAGIALKPKKFVFDI